jgi:endonuclease/exonuclease/phosphatase (EEP) superfamily protein YafD
MIRRLLAAALVVVAAAVLLIAVWPQLFALEWTTVIAQVVALRGGDVAIAVAGIIVLLVVAAVWSRVRRLAGTLALLLLIFCGVSIAVLAGRGFGGPGFETKGSEDLTVLSWNTEGDAPGASAIAALALSSHADIVTLPETTSATGIAIAAIMRAAGRPMWVHTTSFDAVSKARSTTLLISTALGQYTVQRDVGNTTPLPTVVASPNDGVGPTIIATHPVAPVPGEMTNWRADLTWLASMCSGKNTIIAGDFNSTLDHYGRLAGSSTSDFGQCSDAAKATGNAGVGTWPTNLPPFFGTPIDHVMYTHNWKVTGMRVVENQDGAGSDHRPIIAQLSPAK